MMKGKNPDDVFIVLTSYLPTPSLLGEQKSKPTQRAVLDLYSVGLKPDFVLCRADRPATSDIKRTISNVCSIPVERIISDPTCILFMMCRLISKKKILGHVA